MSPRFHMEYGSSCRYVPVDIIVYLVEYTIVIGMMGKKFNVMKR